MSFDIVGLIMEYEAGELDAEDTLTLFSKLVQNGMAWKLQGHYGRTAAVLIESGYLDSNGMILREPE